jgi:hypothetical protein
MAGYDSAHTSQRLAAISNGCGQVHPQILWEDLPTPVTNRLHKTAMNLRDNCSQRRCSQEQTHMPRWVLWFISNLRIKNGISHTYIHDCTDHYSSNTKLCSFFTRITSYILEQLSIVSTAANESIPSPLSKQTESSHWPREIGRPKTSHWWLGLAIFKLGLPRSCWWSWSQPKHL